MRILNGLLLFISLHVFAQGEVVLTYKIHAPVTYQMSGHSLEIVKLDGAPPQNRQGTQDLTIQVKRDGPVAESDSVMRVMMAFEKAEVSQKLNGSLFYADTQPLLNHGLLVKMRPTGQVLDVPAYRGFPRVRTGPDDYEGQNYARVLKRLLPRLPEKPVKPGDEWTFQTVDSLKDISTLSILHLDETFRFVKIVQRTGRRCALVKGERTGDVEVHREIQNRFHKIVTGKETQTVTFWIDLDEGLLVEEKRKRKMSGDVDSPGDQPFKGTITFTGNATVKMKK